MEDLHEWIWVKKYALNIAGGLPFSTLQQSMQWGNIFYTAQTLSSPSPNTTV